MSKEDIKTKVLDLVTAKAKLATARKAHRVSHEEMASRKAAMEQHEHHMRSVRAELYKQAIKDKIITKEVIDVLIPEHAYDNCSDKNLKRERDGCDRCTLLKALTDPWIIDDDIEILLRVIWDPA